MWNCGSSFRAARRVDKIASTDIDTGERFHIHADLLHGLQGLANDDVASQREASAASTSTLPPWSHCIRHVALHRRAMRCKLFAYMGALARTLDKGTERRLHRLRIAVPMAQVLLSYAPRLS